MNQRNLINARLMEIRRQQTLAAYARMRAMAAGNSGQGGHVVEYPVAIKFICSAEPPRFSGTKGAFRASSGEFIEKTYTVQDLSAQSFKPFDNEGNLVSAYSDLNISSVLSIEIPEVKAELSNYGINDIGLSALDSRNNGMFINLASVSADNISSVGFYAFADYSSMHQQHINSFYGKNVKVIGSGAFYNCKYLQTIYFPSLGSNPDSSTFMDLIDTFNGCNLTSVASLSNYAESIGENAFKGNSNLGEAVFPYATGLGNSAFYGCTSLSAVNFQTVGYIGNRCFMHCSSLTSISLPSLRSLDNKHAIFQGCANLQHIYVPRIMKSEVALEGFFPKTWAMNTDDRTVSIPGCIVHCKDGDYTVQNVVVS